MKYYLDTEFHEYKKDGINTIELISIGIVCEDGREYYAISNEFGLEEVWSNEWLRDNVLFPIVQDVCSGDDAFDIETTNLLVDAYGKTTHQIKEEIIDFIGDDHDVEFYAYFGDYDWVVFCWLFGRMIDLPKNFPMYCRDLKQIMDRVILTEATIPEICFIKGDSLESSKVDLKLHPDYPKQENEHNALADAKWNMELHKFLVSL